jgi:hypothetical protein
MSLPLHFFCSHAIAFLLTIGQPEVVDLAYVETPGGEGMLHARTLKLQAPFSKL